MTDEHAAGVEDPPVRPRGEPLRGAGRGGAAHPGAAGAADPG
ncbi:hypothetical protein [Kocuria sp. KH4]